MSEHLFEYDLWVEKALLGVVRTALRQVSIHGLREDHHFYITFKTVYPDVEVPSYLREKYPDEMTIVLQHQFWNLEIREKDFEVRLSFNDERERLLIPFDAITGFADPSVKFGLEFRGSAFEEKQTYSSKKKEEHTAEDTLEETGEPKSNVTTNDVISLDQFRKNR